MLLGIIGGCNSWAEVEAQISTLPEELERGNAFEEFCEAYFALSELHQFTKVYRHRDIPPSLCKKLGYPDNKEIGIDGLGVTNDGKLVAWQSKFRKNRSNTPTKRELSTFFNFSDRADWRITITNADRIPPEIDDRVRQSKVLSDKLDALEPEFFERLREYLRSKVVKHKPAATAHRTQQEAINAALEHFQTEDRGQLILPCGTGKTLAALWIAERLGGSRFLVMLPSLSLMDQTLREWATNTSFRPFRYQCLCSDTSVDLGDDTPIEHICDMEVPVTTDVDSVADFLKSDPQISSVLFSTYQSGKVLTEAVKSSGVKFDVGIFDEAHRTTGSESLWGLALDNGNVPVSKRIFMTATPRIFAPHITKKAQENDILLCSMDDHSIYGRPFYEMTFGEAIERGHITDYRVIVICVTDREVQQLITQDGRIVADGHEWDAKAFAKRVALVKAIREYGLRKVFTFHGKVKTADAFTSTKTPYGISQVARLLDPSGQTVVPQCFHVNGAMSSGTRKKHMDEFKRADIGIMSNARCLTEGVDVPAVDAVAFIDPKRSLIDIVQATGRALRIPRKDSGYTKHRGYIFIPVFVEENADPEKMLESSEFDSVWKVIQAMKGQDQRLEDEISQLRVMQGKGEEGTQSWRDAMAEYAEKITFFNMPQKVESGRIVETLYARTLEVVGQNWDFWYGLLGCFVQDEGHARVPAKYVTADGYKLGGWVYTQRANGSTMSEDRKKRLEALSGWSWDALTDKWGDGFRHLVEFVRKEGHARVPAKYVTVDGHRLGSWVNAIRSHNHNLYEDRRKRLEALPGWSWDVLTDKWEEGFNILSAFVQKVGHARVPQSYRTFDGYKLGQWVSNQRNNKEDMSEDRRRRLETLSGWSWFLISDQWENGFNYLVEYIQKVGHARVASNHVTADGYKLGVWVSNNRRKKMVLSEDRRKRLEALSGWSWDAYKDKWEDGFQHLVEFVQQNGHARVPREAVASDGFRLGQWVRTQQRTISRLSQERKERLEAFDGWVWGRFSNLWEDGFSHLEAFVKQEGHARVPHLYKALDGYRLGSWVGSQRRNKEKISRERKNRLEALSGWVWDILDAQWEEGFSHLEEYVLLTGSARVPHAFVMSDGYKLGFWVATQRTRQINLPEDRRKRLEALTGWVWSAR